MANGYRRSHFDYAFDYRTVDFHRGNVESYASFGRTFNLFGDGSLRLAHTPGHSAGHMSVICRLSKRDFVIDGDCFYVVASSTAPSRCRHAPKTPTTHGGPCRSCGFSARSFLTR
jgi:glyoxylase-like metal-dependent hydrolase (beta-lactamase superfamily II)